MRGVPVKIKALVRDRAGGCCELCGLLLWVPFDGWIREHSFHHRQPRGMGGTTTLDTAANLLLLCGTGTTGCHGRVESNRAEAYEQGWLVRRPKDPAVTTVVIGFVGGSRAHVLLTDDGRYEDAA